MNYKIKDIDSAIMRFRGKYLFLSNFYEGDMFTYKGYSFTNTESAFQSQKCLERVCDFSMMRPSQSKKVGRIVPLRKDWESIKDQVMYDVCYAKFTQSEELKSMLLATGDKELIEWNSHGDRCWGMTYSKYIKTWVGENRLGIILMKLREELK